MPTPTSIGAHEYRCPKNPRRRLTGNPAVQVAKKNARARKLLEAKKHQEHLAKRRVYDAKRRARLREARLKMRQANAQA